MGVPVKELKSKVEIINDARVRDKVKGLFVSLAKLSEDGEQVTFDTMPCAIHELIDLISSLSDDLVEANSEIEYLQDELNGIISVL